MTAGSGAVRPGAAGGHCRVTVVAPTRRVDVALPEDVPLAELLPELLRLVGAPGPATGPAALSGYVLTGFDGTALDTAAALSDQGVVDGGILRLRPADDVPEAAVHDDIADAVAEAVLAGSSQWSATALRATALAVVGIAAGLGAIVLWFSGTGTFHGWKGVIAGVIALLLFTLGVLRARYDPTAVGRGATTDTATRRDRKLCRATSGVLPVDEAVVRRPPPVSTTRRAARRATTATTTTRTPTRGAATRRITARTRADIARGITIRTSGTTTPSTAATF
ncbi:EsaB/YukD family protein [Catenulispora yoronensis]